MRPAVGAPARAYIRTGVIQKPVLRIRKYAMLRYATLWRIFYAKLRKNPGNSIKNGPPTLKGHI
jgi:hypothetical protein